MALDYELLKSTYPFTRLTGRPTSWSCGTPLGPHLLAAHAVAGRRDGDRPVIDGLSKPVQIVQMGATVSDLVNHAALAPTER